MVRFIIVRHGHSTGNKDNIFCGQLDVPLNETGFLQARQTGEWIAKNYKIDEIWSSDLVRVTETVRPLADALGLPINTDKRLREVDVGEWQGVPVTDIERDFPEELALYRKFPARYYFRGGEGYTDMIVRVADFFEEKARTCDGRTIAVGTHGGCIRTLIAYVNRLPLDRIGEIPFVPNASVTELIYNDGKWEFGIMSYAEHLEERSGKSLVV